MPPSLLDLPNELLHLIIDKVQDHCLEVEQSNGAMTHNDNSQWMPLHSLFLLRATNRLFRQLIEGKITFRLISEVYRLEATYGSDRPHWEDNIRINAICCPESRPSPVNVISVLARLESFLSSTIKRLEVSACDFYSMWTQSYVPSIPYCYVEDCFNPSQGTHSLSLLNKPGPSWWRFLQPVEVFTINFSGCQTLATHKVISKDLNNAIHWQGRPLPYLDFRLVPAAYETIFKELVFQRWMPKLKKVAICRSMPVGNQSVHPELVIDILTAAPIDWAGPTTIKVDELDDWLNNVDSLMVGKISRWLEEVRPE